MMSTARLALILAGAIIVSAQVPDNLRSYRCKSSNSILFVPLDGEGSALWKTVNTSLVVAKEHCEARSMRLPLLDKWFDTQCMLEYSKLLEIATGVVLPKLLVSADQCTATVSNVHVYTTRIQSAEVESAQYTGRYFCLLPVPRCPPMTPPENGYLSFDNDRLRSSNVRVYCNPGYRPLGKSIFRCLTNASWELGNPFCEQELTARMGCRDLQQPSSGIVKFSKNLTPGSQATYTCNAGYYLNGNKVLTCNVVAGDPSWNAPAPSCLPLPRCSSLIKPRYASMDVTTEAGIPRIATFSCHNGFSLTGNSSISCGADSLWSAPAPTCSP